MERCTRILARFVAASALAASFLTAQAPKPAEGADAKRLEALLEELRKIDPRAWEERLRGMEEQAKKLDAEQERLAKQAQALQAESERARAGAAAIRGDIEKQKQLRALLGAPAAPDGKPVAKDVPASKDAALPKDVARPASMPAKDAVAAAPEAAAVLTWDEHILPIVEQHCVACHNPGETKGNLSLTTYAAARQGGGSGEVIRPRDPDGSRLWRLVAHKEKPTMPPDQGPIPAAQIAKLRTWIEQGAHENAPSPGAKMPDAAPAATPPAAEPGPVPAPAPATPPRPPKEKLQSPKAAARRIPIRALAASPALPVAAAPGLGQVLLYGADAACLGGFPFESGEVAALAFSRDGAVLLAGGGVPGQSGAAELFDMRSGERVRSFGKERDVVAAVAISPRQTLVALGGAGQRARIFRTATGEPVAEVKEHNDWITAIAFSPDGNWIATADRAGVVCVSEADTGLNVLQLRGHEGAVHALRFRADAKALASGGADGTARWWETDDGKPIRSIAAQVGEVLDLDWRKDGVFLTAGSTGVVKTWKPDGAPLAASQPLGDWVYGARFDSSGDTVLAGDWLGRIHALDARTLKPAPPPAPSSP